jgi:peptide/nickel transport system substrate-binding protein
MLRKRLFLAFSLLIIASMVLAACQTKEKIVTQIVNQTSVVKETQVVEKPGEEVIVTQEVEKIVTQEVEKIVTQVVEKIVEVTPTPVMSSRHGGWLDQIVFVEEPSAQAAIKRLQTGDLDAYFYTVANPDVLKSVQESPELTYSSSYGSYNELTFNTFGPTFIDGRISVFSNPKIREAINWLIDRNYIAQEVTGGLAIPRFFAMAPTFADYARYADLAAQYETYYAYNFDKAKEIITAEMEAMGATLEGGKWMDNGAPITLVGLIRTEDERTQIGDYFSSQLEEIGFTVDRQYKTSAEAAPIWQGTVEDGIWNFYTGGWITTAVPRTEEDNFTDFYMPEGWPGNPLWDSYTNDPAYREAALKLYNREYSTLEERRALFEVVMPGAMKEAQRVWTSNRASFTPYRKEVSVVGDLAGAAYGSRLWAYTLRRIGQEGGAMTIAMPSILTNPWNPLGGSNWIYDQSLTRASSDWGTIPDPWTGLSLNQRVERAEVVAKEGLPIGVTKDWVTLTFAPSIEVPADALSDWNPETQTFITAGEAFTETQTAAIKSTVYYREDLAGVTWHDGSPIDVADFVMVMIMNFDRGYEASAVYDPAAATTLAVFKSTFKGFKIVSESPLVIEYYTNNWQADAENDVTSLWPIYAYGPAGWHSLAVGLMAEAAGELAFSQAKSKTIEKEWMNYISGPSVDILKTQLETAVAENYIPYAPTLGQYITADEAAARWANYAEFVRARGHFWVGTGPYYIERAFPVEGIVVLKNYTSFVDLSSRWAGFGAPPIPVVDITAPADVTIGSEASFDVDVSFDDQPYMLNDILSFKYLVFDATGVLAFSGEGEAVGDGMYTITFTAEQTAKLVEGSTKLTVVVVSKLESIPTFESVEFVTVK